MEGYVPARCYLKGFVQNRPPERVFRENVRYFLKTKNEITDEKQA